jgi:hypothetical protein
MVLNHDHCTKSTRRPEKITASPRKDLSLVARRSVEHELSRIESRHIREAQA